ncbi:glycosyltransferase family 2 protein [Paeniglutamicibacter cryotolerans]
MPVLNEEPYLRAAVQSVLAQEYQGSKEIVLAVGPSTDGTEELVAQLCAEDSRIKAVPNPQGRTPIGLNLAIRASSHEVVIRVDAHSELEPDYTSRGVQTLLRTGAHDVGGLMDARGRSPFQRAVAAAYHSPLGLGGAAYHSSAPEGPAESAYLGIFQRSVFDEVGYFDETLWRGQDWEMCLRIRQAGLTVWFDPELRTGYFPRESFRKLSAQSYASGVWRGELAKRYSEGKSMRHQLPPLMVAGTTLGLAALLIDALLGKSIPTVPRRLMKLAKLAPVAYVGLLAVAIAKTNEGPARERLLLLGVLPSIHFPWAFGFVKGRVRGANGTLDKGRVR